MPDQPQLSTAFDLADRHRPQGHRKKTKTDTKRHRHKDHFPKVVQFVYMSRYATSHQIQARFPEHFNCARSRRRHLEQLTKSGYLALVDVKSLGIGWPNVYFCTPKGTDYLREQFGHQLVNARDEKTKLDSIEHELFLTQFDLWCLALTKARPDLALCFHERRYYHADKVFKLKTTDPETGKPTTKLLKPDAGFILKVSAGERVAFLHYFVEVDNGTERNNVILTKWQKYRDYFGSPDGQATLIDQYRKQGSQNPKATFRLVVIARRPELAGTDDRRLADLIVQALAVPQLLPAMWFATADTLKAHQNDTPPLSGPLWFKGKDMMTWLDDYHCFTAQLTDKGTKLADRKRDYILERLPDMNRHALFQFQTRQPANK